MHTSFYQVEPDVVSRGDGTDVLSFDEKSIPLPIVSCSRESCVVDISENKGVWICNVLLLEVAANSLSEWFERGEDEFTTIFVYGDTLYIIELVVGGPVPDSSVRSRPNT